MEMLVSVLALYELQGSSERGATQTAAAKVRRKAG